MNFRIHIQFVILLLFVFAHSYACGEGWKEVKGKHFVVHYSPQIDVSTAKKVLRKAEGYYQKIGRLIGYSRYSKFWTWDKRVEIILFADKKTFVEKTGQPAWSTGYSQRERYASESKSIVSYHQEDGFVDGLLPHEVSHLILGDFLGGARAPIWFDEGIAQFKQLDRRAMAKQYMRAMVRQGRYIPLKGLMNLDIRQERDDFRVKLFYLQSVSIIDFLVTKYGSDAFGKLCRGLRERKSFNEALRGAYRNSIESIDDLEKKWVKHLSK